MNKELKIGLFAVAILVVSFFLINYLRGEDIFNNEIELTSRYENIEGLVASAPVYIKGYKAGRVSEVRYDSEAEDFIVTCSILKDFRIPSDSRMTIYSVDIMGGKGVRIDLGSSPDAAKDGDALAPSFEAGLMDGLSDGVGPLLAKVGNTLDSLTVTVSNVNRLLSEENQAAVSRSLAHLEDTMESLNELSSTVNGRSGEIENLLTSLSAFSSSLQGIAVKVDSAMDDVADIAGSLDGSEIESLIASFKELLENVNDPEGTFGRLLSDDSIYSSVDSLLSDIDVLVRKIQENPKKYLKISVF